MRVSVSLTNYSWPGGPAAIGTELARTVRIAEQAGVDTAWVSDHLLQADPTSNPDDEMLEAYTTLGFLAGQTQRIRLGAMVTNAALRQPAVLVKMVTSLDVLSAGRAWLGIGAGYHTDEAAAMGFALPPVAERFQRMEETLLIALHMWSGKDTTPIETAHYRLARPVTNPKPVRQPHPPILIGGMGESRTLRLVARYADACNMFDIPDGGRTLRHKLSVLADHCEAAGRAYQDIEKTVNTRLSAGESADSFVARCTALGELGFGHVTVITPGPWTEERLATLAEAIPTLNALP